MKKRALIRTLTLALAFNMAAATELHAQRQRPEPQRPQHSAEIAIDESSGKVLYEHNANVQLYPASTTKLMTAYLTFKALKEGKLTLDQTLKVSSYAAWQPSTNLWMAPEVSVKTVTVLKNGKKIAHFRTERPKQVTFNIKAETALRGMLCHSANDAAVVFAEAIAGSETEFVGRMNAEAKRLGMTHTHFANTNGLPNTSNKSTVEDMAKLARAIIEDFPEYYKYFSIPSITFNGNTRSNTNHLLGVYPGMDGMKTGWIGASGWNLVASAKHGDTRVIGIVFGAATSESRFQAMQHLLDFAFRKAKNPSLRYAYGPDSANNKPERFVDLPPKLEAPQPPALANAANPPAVNPVPAPAPLPSDSVPAPKETPQPLVSLPPKAKGPDASFGSPS